MAGSEQAGIEGADPLLLRAPHGRYPGSFRAGGAALELITGLGARPLLLPPRSMTGPSRLPATCPCHAAALAGGCGRA